MEPSPWRKAQQLVRGDRSDLLAITIYAVGVGVLSLALPLTVQILVNTVTFGTLIQPIVVLTLMLGAGLIFAAVLQALQAWMVEIVQRRLFVRLVSQLAERLPRWHVSSFEQSHGPELLNRFFDVFLAQKALSSLALGGIEAVLTASVGLILLAFYHPVLLAFGALITSGVAFVVLVLGRGATASAVKESKAKYAVAGWLEEMARHLFALKLAGGAAFSQRKLDSLAAEWLAARSEHYGVVFRQYLGVLGLKVLTSASLLGLGGWLVVQRELTIGQLVAAELIVTAVVASLSKLAGKLESAYDFVASADKINVLLDLPLERATGESPRHVTQAARVECRGVTTRSHELEDFSVTIESGQCVAITGGVRESEALVDLLFGLRETSRGAVLLDGNDLRDLSLASLRSRVAVVRGLEILPGTVAENMGIVGRKIASAEIWEALETVGLSDRVRALPEGLQTVLHPTGTPLTRADALRLTLARALVARPALLVLDGALDALPPASGQAILERLNRVRVAEREQTVLFVTHTEQLAAHADLHLRMPETHS